MDVLTVISWLSCGGDGHIVHATTPSSLTGFAIFRALFILNSFILRPFSFKKTHSLHSFCLPGFQPSVHTYIF